MSLEPKHTMNLSELKAENEKLKATAADLQAKLAASETATADALAKLKTTDETVAALADKVAALEAKASAGDTTIASLNAEVATLKSKDKSASQKALEILAQAGHPPIEVKDNAVASGDKEDLHAQFKAITDPKKRAAFYESNKSALLGKK